MKRKTKMENQEMCVKCKFMQNILSTAVKTAINVYGLSMQDNNNEDDDGSIYV